MLGQNYFRGDKTTSHTQLLKAFFSFLWHWRQLMPNWKLPQSPWSHQTMLSETRLGGQQQSVFIIEQVQAADSCWLYHIDYLQNQPKCLGHVKLNKPPPSLFPHSMLLFTSAGVGDRAIEDQHWMGARGWGPNNIRPWIVDVTLG